ncbi:hypothetical protein ACFL7M_17480 [Thermodesulfobacteriota bacterium]
MKIKIKHIAPLIAVFFIVGIAGTMAFNLWNTAKIKEPARYISGKFAGEYDPSDIRGSFTFADINKSFNVPVEDLAKAFGFKDSANPEALRAKDVEGTYGAVEGGELGTDSIRMFVAYYLGLPFVGKGDTLLPRPAVSILKSKGKVTEEQLAFLEKITIDLAVLKMSSGETKTSGHEELVDFKVRGKTTFKELLDVGITKEEIEGILGMPMGRAGETVRDYVANKGLEFSGFKVKLEALVKTKK